jgi:hypothetical protein
MNKGRLKSREQVTSGKLPRDKSQAKVADSFAAFDAKAKEHRYITKVTFYHCNKFNFYTFFGIFLRWAVRK